MKPIKEIKRVQVAGKKYFVPVEDQNIEKLLQKGLRLKAKIDIAKSDLDTVQNRLIEIAQARREGTTTVTLPGISAKAVITFRESFAVNDDIEEIAIPLGPLFKRFFKKKGTFKTTPEFKKFMGSGHALGIDDPEAVKKAILDHVSIKETKPNVKMEKKDDD